MLDTGELLADPEESDVYERLGLPWIPPEQREGSGEVEAALAGTLPTLVTLADVRGDTHTHSDWTDGVDSIEVMARAARDLGHEYIVLTDHSPSLGVARGLVAGAGGGAACRDREDQSRARSLPRSSTAPSSRFEPMRPWTTPMSSSPGSTS